VDGARTYRKRLDGTGRLAELILEFMGDPPDNRDRAEQVLTAAALLVNGRGEILGNGIDGGPITLPARGVASSAGTCPPM
jgi:hypothetical protein